MTTHVAHVVGRVDRPEWTIGECHGADRSFSSYNDARTLNQRTIVPPNSSIGPEDGNWPCAALCFRQALAIDQLDLSPKRGLPPPRNHNDSNASRSTLAATAASASRFSRATRMSARDRCISWPPFVTCLDGERLKSERAASSVVITRTRPGTSSPAAYASVICRIPSSVR